MLKRVYLTIDDAPSAHLEKIVDFLSFYQIPAVFYVRGGFVEQYCSKVAYAISKGYLIGNHTYSHSCFSELSFEQCQHEILKTELLIDACYAMAGVIRPKKVVRLPFGDRGAGANARTAQNDTEQQHVMQIQKFLAAEGFEKLSFHHASEYIDAYWDWDTQDYKTRHIEDLTGYIKNMASFMENYHHESVVILLHTFDHNAHLFQPTLSFLMAQSIAFLPI